MAAPELFSQLSDDEKIRVHLKAAHRLMLKKKAQQAAALEEIKTGTLRSADTARDYEDALEHYTKTLQNIGLLESIIIFS